MANHYGIDVYTNSTNTSNPLPWDPSVANIYGQMFYNVNDDPNAAPDFFINQPTVQVTPGQTIAIFAVSRVNGIFRGSVKLRSNDPDDDPIFDPNFLAAPEDKIVLAKALNKTLQIIQKLGLTLNPNPCVAGSNCSNELETMNTFLLAGFGGEGYHGSATAAINNVTDPYSLAVKGTRGLYVLDASIMPLTPAGNPQATIYAVSERGILLIIADLLAKRIF